MNKNQKEDLKQAALNDQEKVIQESQDNTDQSDETEQEAPAEEVVVPTCEEELASYKDKHLRMYSDFENFRRRSAKERVELIQNAGQEIIVTLLPILDDFDRAMIANKDSDDSKAIKEGMDLIYNKINSLLTQKGLKVMEAQDADFNSDHHEAIAKIPAPTSKLKGKVLDVTEKGYYLNSKIIRHAKVVIGD